MIRPIRSLKLASCSLAALFALASAAQAQIYYSTDFDSGTDTVNNTPRAANYNVYTASSPTQPLSGLNGWVSNDQTVTTGTPGTSNQLVGQSDYVGPVGQFFGGTNAGALGGVYRTAPADQSGGTPDVVPSTNSGGIVSLYRPISLSPAPTSYQFNVDFALLLPDNPVNATRDSFAMNLANGSGSLITLNFTPSGTSNQDSISYTVGNNTVTAPKNLFLNAQYHLGVSVNVTANTFTGTLQGQSGAAFSFSGSLAGSTIAAGAVDRAGVLWNLADKTATNGAYQDAGSNYLAFDNFVVPEPSTYAWMIAGAVGLGLLLRRERRA